MDFEDCRVCGEELQWENTSPLSMSKGLCHTCENDLQGLDGLIGRHNKK